MRQSAFRIIDKVKSPRTAHWIRLIGNFLLGQGAVQFFGLITGFFLLRWMSVEDYARFSVAFGFQSTLGILVDVGFSGSIIALVGDRFQDKSVVGAYVKAAQKYRNQSFVIIVPLAGIAFYFIAVKHNWSWHEQILLFGSIAASTFFQGWVAYYSAPLLLHQQMGAFYKPQIAGSVVRLMICYALHLVSALSSWANAWINAALIIVNGLFYRDRAASFLDEPAESDPEINRQMLRYISPLIPGVVFTAFQGQISLLIITIFGQTQSVAEVAALGRLGQLFILLGAFNAIVIGPYVAQTSENEFLKRYFQILATAVFISVVICFVGFAVPEPLLWLLGSNYQNLRLEVGWMIAGSCLSYVAGVMWTMHSARRWVYWWGTFGYIGLLTGTQILCTIFIDLSSTLGVVYISLFTASSVILFNVLTAVYGFNRQPSKFRTV